MLLETLLQRQSDHKITNIFTRSHITFFKLNGESFCTAAGRIFHSSSEMYDCSFLKQMAKEAHDPDEHALKEAEMRDADAESDLWNKHKLNAYKVLFTMALQILDEKGEKHFVDFIDSQMEIYPVDAIELARRLERGE